MAVAAAAAMRTERTKLRQLYTVAAAAMTTTARKAAASRRRRGGKRGHS
jgi:hypothetical protein